MLKHLLSYSLVAMTWAILGCQPSQQPSEKLSIQPVCDQKTKTIQKSHLKLSAVKESLATHRLALIGEIHHNNEAQQFIIDNLCTLEINTLYVEFLTTDKQQDFEKSTTKEAIKKLVMYSLVNFADPSKKYDDLSPKAQNIINHYTELLLAAKTFGIRVVPLENVQVKREFTQAVQNSTHPTNLPIIKKRLSDTNTPWSEIIANDLSNPETRGIALIGVDHLGNQLGVPGISQRLGIPSIRMMGGLEWIMECPKSSVPPQKLLPLTLPASLAQTGREIDEQLENSIPGSVSAHTPHDITAGPPPLSHEPNSLNPQQQQELRYNVTTFALQVMIRAPENENALKQRLAIICAAQANQGQ